MICLCATILDSVGMKLGARTTAVTIEAEDALLAALKIKLESCRGQIWEAMVKHGRKMSRVYLLVVMLWASPM